MADVKRFNSKNGIENGTQENNLSMSDILISQHITGDNNDYKLTLAQAQAIPYGVCESLGDEDKTVNLVNYPSTYTAQVGNKVLIKFIHANTKGHVSDNTYPTLTVGGVTKPIAAQGKTIGAGAIVDDQIIELVLTPDYWNIDQNIREVTSAYTILTDGSYIYNKTQIDNNNYTKAQTDSAINGALADYNKSIGYDDTVATTKEELIKKKALIAIDKGLKNNCTCTLAGGWQGNQYGVSIITRLGTKYFVQFYGNNGWNIEGSYDTSSEEILFFTTSVTSSSTEFFSINSDLATLIDVRVYESLRIINFQRLVFTLKNNVTSGSSVHIGTIANERKPRQTMRVTMHDANTHISYECFIEQANGHIMLQANNNINANSTMVIDNFTYIY